jgi:hypothetical protein
VNKFILLFCCLVCLGGCAEFRPNDCADAKPLEPIVVYPSFSSNYLLSCLSDMQTLKRQDFDAQFELAAADLQHAPDRDKLRLICLSLNEKADYKQFKRGRNVLQQYFVDHPDSGADMQGIRLLVDRLDEEIINRWSAWKSLLNDKKELKAEIESLKKELKAKIESLKVTIEEQQKQIEQLKNIENIIKSRETSKP